MPFSSNVVLKKYFNISLSRLLWVIDYGTNIISQDLEIIPADFRGCGSVTVGPEFGVAEWQCEDQLQFCYQEGVDVEHSASRSGGHVIPNQLKLGWPKYCKMCGWLAKDILSVTLGLVLFPSPSPQSFTQQFLCPSLHWQPPTFHSQRPEVCIQSLPKGFKVGHQLSFPESMLALGLWGVGKGHPPNCWGDVREILQVPEWCIKHLLGLCSGPHFSLHTTGGTERQSNTAAAN